MTSPVRALWDAPPASPAPPKRVWRDWALVGAVPVLALVEAAARPEVPWRWAWAGVLVALAPTLLWRRTRPLTMLATAFGVGWIAALALGGDPELVTTAYFLVLVYAVMRWGSGRAMIGGAVLVLVGVLVPFATGSPTLADIVGGLAVVATTSTLGVTFRLRAAARARELDRTRLLERERLARDLHDTVAHHVSAIAVQAQAGTAVASGDPDAAARVLRIIEGEASRTLDEMRSIVRVLRDDETDAVRPAPAAGAADLLRLADGDARPRVDVQVDGDLESVPPLVAATAFRIAQEAVTNARRHARDATRIAVHARIDEAGLRLEVRDDGAATPSAPAPVPPGYGIRGMVERAALLGGTCTAQPDPDGGWAVTATLPRAGWPA